VAIVVRNINHALPLELRDVSGRAAGTITAPNIGAAEGAAEYQSQVAQIVFAINDRNSSQMMDFRNAYLAYMADPCGKGDLLERALNKIMDERNRLATLEIRARTLIKLIQQSPDRADQILLHCTSIMTDLDLPTPHAAVKAIEGARREAQEMIGDPE
jgi:hypothetical protein